MKRTLHLKVTDQLSTLNRITSAFVRLQYNISELTVKRFFRERHFRYGDHCKY